ncbi:PREDICTED: E3 SUMO-protein ligase PIAS1-like [Diuraphis noxia]|uniref:E3 SUMO-protein ligase PIAS1-like n=1 Tax=Diuraphis noxia TaxID=143948 RepID=UPI00076372E8|nr:PREDICTED: E3 SUMO-protein ligase PIAS1-like [Diuraphis noxia]
MNQLTEGGNRSSYPRNLPLQSAVSDFAIYDSIFEGASHIQFRPLPFHRVRTVLVPTMRVEFKPFLRAAGVDNVNCRFGADFYLSLSDVVQISTQYKDGKPTCKLQIRIGEMIPELGDISEILPQPIKAWINTKQVPIDVITSPLVLDAVDYLHLNTVNVNTLRFLWPPCYSTFFLTVYLVDMIAVEEVVREIQTNEDRFILAFNTKKTATELLERSGSDLDVTSYKLSLLCPIIKIRMTLPAKSIYCKHLQCFDLQAFISSNKMKPSWYCPLCFATCKLDHLKIDSFLLFVVNSIKVPKTCKEIELYANGKWKPCIVNRGISGIFCGPSEKNILEIDLDNSDDEDPGNIVRTLLPRTNSGNSNDSKLNVCIDTPIKTGETNSEEDQP